MFTRANLKEMLNATGLGEGSLGIAKTWQAYQWAVNEVLIVSVTDLAGKIIYVNNKFVEISQYQPAELLGKTHRVLNSGHHNKTFFEEMWRTITGGKPWRGEIKNKAKDGTYYWVDSVITPVRDDNNRIFQYLSIRNPITQQKIQEEKAANFQKELIRKKEQLKYAQEMAKTGNWVFDRTENLMEWSEETNRIFDLSLATILTFQVFLKTVHIKDRVKVRKAWMHALRTGTNSFEHRIVTAQGTKWVSQRVQLEFNSKGALARAFGTVQDITEKKNVENLLRKSETWYKRLFNESPFAIGIMDKTSLKFLQVNETALKLYGYTLDEVMNLTLFDIRLPEDRKKIERQIIIGSYEKEMGLRAHRKKNGDIILVEPTIVPIKYKGIEAYLVSIVDRTEKLLVSEELKKTKDNLQKEIINASIRAQELKQIEIGRELHDNINQLLVASTLYLSKIEPLNDSSKKLLVNSHGIIKDAIAEIRKLSSRLTLPTLKKTDLQQSIKYLAAVFDITQIKGHFNINVFEESLLEDGLKVAIYRIIQEQFSNILKYAHASEVNVVLKSTIAGLELIIKDNGQGFDQQQERKGIGFNNIFQRAEAFNGRVEITSKPGEGCEVNITFQLP
jgi:PAS domain S-box-containing protein